MHAKSRTHDSEVNPIALIFWLIGYILSASLITWKVGKEMNWYRKLLLVGFALDFWFLLALLASSNQIQPGLVTCLAILLGALAGTLLGVIGSAYYATSSPKKPIDHEIKTRKNGVQSSIDNDRNNE